MRITAVTLGSPDRDEPPRRVTGELFTYPVPVLGTVNYLVGGEYVDPKTVRPVVAGKEEGE
jgi:hypothetical protein